MGNIMTPPKRKKKPMKNFCDNCGCRLTDIACSAGHFVRLFEYRLQHKHQSNPSEEACMVVKILKAERAVIKAAKKWYRGAYYENEINALCKAIDRLNKLKESK